MCFIALCAGLGEVRDDDRRSRFSPRRCETSFSDGLLILAKLIYADKHGLVARYADKSMSKWPCTAPLELHLATASGLQRAVRTPLCALYRYILKLYLT